MDEGKPPPPASATVAVEQGLTLVHFSAQLERFLWDRGTLRVGVV